MKVLKVLCISDDYITFIKKNKWYNVIETNNEKYYRVIFDEPDIKYNVEKKDFLTIRELRKEKLNKIKCLNL